MTDSKPLTTWKPVTQDRYDEMLNVLPPLRWNSLGFLVGEAYSERTCTETARPRQTFTALAKVGGQHFEALEALTVPEWLAMTPAKIAAAPAQAAA